ncbi:MAG: hypothetical protein WA931_00070 [Rhodococcus sp. (in: high G+C Gram-positive bacteria)]
MSTPFPRPGQHRPSDSGDDGSMIDPARVVEQIDQLLVDADDAASSTDDYTSDPHGLVRLTRQAQILDRAHDVLVDALASVDKTSVEKTSAGTFSVDKT